MPEITGLRAGYGRVPILAGVSFAMAEGEKCQRCWMILPDVGSHAYPGVCARCDAAVGH